VVPVHRRRQLRCFAERVSLSLLAHGPPSGGFFISESQPCDHSQRRTVRSPRQSPKPGRSKRHVETPIETTAPIEAAHQRRPQNSAKPASVTRGADSHERSRPQAGAAQASGSAAGAHGAQASVFVEEGLLGSLGPARDRSGAVQAAGLHRAAGSGLRQGRVHVQVPVGPGRSGVRGSPALHAGVAAVRHSAGQQWIQNLGNAHRTLALGSPEQKLQMFAKLATDYGVPMQAHHGGQVRPAVFACDAERLNAPTQSLRRSRRQSAEQARMQQEIQAFKANAPHFEAVKGDMASSYRAASSSDLKTAYDKAIRLHDDLWQQEQARQAQDAEAESSAERLPRRRRRLFPQDHRAPQVRWLRATAKRACATSLSEQLEAHSTGRF
jgi:hypothetical protein